MNIINDTQDAAIPIEDAYALFALQHGMLVNALLEPGSGVDLEQLLCELHEALDVVAFRRAWQCVVARHPVLRTNLRWENLDEPRQEVRARVDLPWEEQDWRLLDADHRDKYFADFLDEDRLRGFDLARAPLFRLTLLRYGDAEYRLILTFHHTILEGRSYLLVLREVFAFYEAFRCGSDITLPLPRPYRDYIDWIQQQDFSKDETFWRETLKGFTAPTPLAVDHASDTSRDRRPGHGFCELALPAQITSTLRALAQANRLTVNTIVQGVWGLLLSRYSGEADVVFGVVRGNRRSTIEGAEAMIGLFLNTLPLRLQVDPEAPLLSWLHEVRRQWTAMRGHEHTPLATVQGWSEVPGGTSLFNSTMMFENYHLDTMLQEEGGAWSNRRFRLFLQTNYPVSLAAFDGAALRLRVDFDRRRIDEGAARRMLGHLQTLFEAIAADPGQCVGELPLLTQSERRQLLVEWNDTAADYPGDRCIHHLFEAQAARTPETVAVVFEDRQLTYAELNARATRLARHLIALGVGPDVLVGLCVERSLEMVVGLLGILKAGGAYVPLDPAYPSERLAFMLEDTGAQVVLTQGTLSAALSRTNARIVCLDRDWPVIEGQSSATIMSEAGAENLAYMIYTSGSTGHPKGTLIPHRAIVNHMQWMQATFPMNARDCVLQKTPFSFDASVWEFFAPLTVGARLVMARPAGHQDPAYLVDMITRHQVTILQLVPTSLRMLLDTAEFKGCHSLRHVFCGGEAMTGDIAQRFFAALDADLHNMYGPTEAAIDSLYYTVPREHIDEAVPIGRPLANTQAYVLDGHGQPQPIGVAGELYLGGGQVGRGYHGQPELTAEKFLPDPFSVVPGARLYRTGDLARYQPDGNIVFLGRVDDQVKIRGFRIELGEVEAVLAGHAAVREAVILAREDSPGDKRLVAYVVPADPSFADIEALRAYARGRLPEYMQPAAHVVLESLPLMRNGKIDKRALPPPQYGHDGTGEALVPPRDALEEVIAEVWREVLQIERVGVRDNFFELGGQSLLAVQVLARVARLLRVELPLRDFFAMPTVSALAAAAHTKLGADSGASPAPIAPAPHRTNLPLSFAQKRMWFLDRLLPDKSAYNIPAAWRLRGRLDVSVLERSLNALVARHDALRTRFAVREGEPVQVIDAPHAMALPLDDLSALEPGEREAHARNIADEEVRQPFDLETGPLLRARLLRLAPEAHVLLLHVHHIASDGWSMGVIERELSAVYTAFANGRESPLPALPIQYADYAMWQRERLQGEVLHNQLDYWKTHLAQINALELPTDRPRPPVSSYEGAHLHFDLPAPLTEALKALGRREGATLFMTLLAAFQVLLYRYSGQPAIVVGSPIAGRGRSELEGLIGFFVNTLVLRTDLSGNPPFLELLARVRENAVDAYTHQDLPFEKLVEELAPPRDMSRNPLFDVMFALQNAPATALALEGVEASLLPLQPSGAKLDLTLVVHESAQGLHARWEYASDLFDAATITRMARHFEVLLEAVVTAPGQRIDDLRLLTESELRQLLVDWNDTAAAYPRDRCIHELFEAQAARTPEAVAAVFEDKQLTYAELNARANQLARHLAALGVGPEVLVAICLERSLELIVALLGTLKAGGAYVPMDPSHPTERLAFILEDTEARVVVTQSHASAALPSTSARMVYLDRDSPVIGNRGTEAIVSSAGPESLAYVIYTSGSTGIPKGVQITHRAISRLVCNTDYIDIKPADRFAQASVATFDAATFEIWGALVNGARIVGVPRDVALSPHDFAEFLSRHGITVLFLTTALFNQMAREAPGAFRPLRYVLFGGETVDPTAVRAVLRNTPPTHLLHVYGPTEVTTFSTWHPITELADAATTVPIGRPIANTTAYVLDERRLPVPVGVPGELYLGGDGLARGYLKRPELTAEHFVASPFSADPGARLYRSGDWVRLLANGAIEFIGRRDQQVKVRGFRIEPGEVEAVLAGHASVRQVVVVAREDAPGDRRLVAYVVPVDASMAQIEPLRAFLRERLPEFMQPSAYLFLERLPLTPNGKIDRRALPAMDVARSHETAYVPPGTEWESKLAAVWQKVLRVEKVSVDDNFFDLGGHSLLIVQLIHEINRTYKVTLGVPEVFRNPTVQQLATIIEQLIIGSKSKRQPSVVQLREGQAEVPVYFIYAGPDEFRLAQLMGGDRPAFGIDVPWPLAWCDAVSKNRESAFPRMEQLVAPYAAALSAHAQGSPCVLAGHSFAGLIAFEVAHHFQRQGGKVEMVLLFDSWTSAPSPYQVAWHNLGNYWRSASARLPGHRLPRSIGARLRSSWRIARWLIRQEKERLRHYLTRHTPTWTDLTTTLDEQGMPLPGRLVSRLYKTLQRSHRLRPLASRGILFRADLQDEHTTVPVPDETLGWKDLFESGLEVIPIAGSHLSIMREHSPALASELNRVLDQHWPDGQYKAGSNACEAQSVSAGEV